MRLAHKHAGISALAELEPRPPRAQPRPEPPAGPAAAPKPSQRFSLRRLARTR